MTLRQGLRRLALLAVLLPAAAMAQEQQVDPRIAVPLVRALQAQVALQEVQLKAISEDGEAQKATLWRWLIEARQAKVSEAPK